MVSIKNLSFKFNKKFIIEDFSLEIKDFEFISILGSSGCGKTTLLKLISGLLKPYGGHIEKGNLSRIGYIFQDDRLIPWKTVYGNLRLINDDKESIKTVLEEVGLIEHISKYPGELSGGMIKRVSIARAILYKFDMLLLDEPFGSLDVLTREKIISVISNLWKKKKRTFVMVTHDPFEAASLSTRVLIVSKKFKNVKCLEINKDDNIQNKKFIISERLMNELKEMN